MNMRMRMQFSLDGVSAEGVRSGRIVWSRQTSAPTPLFLPYTRAGAVPHLTADVAASVLSSRQDRLALLPLPTLFETPGLSVMTHYQKGIHNFTGLRDLLNTAVVISDRVCRNCDRQCPSPYHCGDCFLLKDHFVYLCVQDPPCPPHQGYNEDKNVSIWCKGGRHKVGVTEYLKLVEAVRPNVFECLCDSVSSSGQKLKRMRKSVDRTLKFLDHTIALRSDNQVLSGCGLLGAIEGGDLLEERRRSARETAKRPVDGFVFEGFDLAHSEECLSDLLSSCTELLPHHKPRFTHGLHTPDEIFTALECGVDVFDGSYPYTATKRGSALVFTNSLPEVQKELNCDRVGVGVGLTDTSMTSQQEINLTEERYALDLAPLVSGCVCYACSQHSRAYVHHLLLTNEILARVLLMIHNMSHYLQFFANLRHSLGNSSYALFKQTCTTTNWDNDV